MIGYHFDPDRVCHIPRRLLWEFDVGNSTGFEHNPLALIVDGNGVAYTFDPHSRQFNIIDTASGIDVESRNLELGTSEFTPGIDFSIADGTILLPGEEPGTEGEGDVATIRRFSLDGEDLGRHLTFRSDETAWEEVIRITTDAHGNFYCITVQTVFSTDAAAANDESPFTVSLLLRAFDQDGDLMASGQLGPVGNAYPDLGVSVDGKYLYITDPVRRQVLIYERTL
jgi:hypothetical protein